MIRTGLAQDNLANAVRALDWDCHNASTRFLTHGIHRYSGKFIPQVARQMIELLSAPGDIVLDPFCGSGTTLLEAVLTNRQAIGLDLNPLAVLISKVKCTSIPKASVIEWYNAFDRHVATITDGAASNQVSLFGNYSRNSNGDTDSRLQGQWYKKWFKPDVLSQLVAIDACIQSVSDTKLRQIARIAFSEVLRRSSNASSKYPNVMFDRKITKRPLPAPVFRSRLRETCSAVAELDRAVSSSMKPLVLLGDARRLPIKDATVDAIVTHPPYIGSIPYAEYQALNLTWFGYDPKELDSRLAGGRRQSPDVVRRFEDALDEALREFRRVLKPGRFIGILIGNPVVKGELVRLDKMVENLASESGLVLETKATRRGINRRANKMLNETILFFRNRPLSA